MADTALVNPRLRLILVTDGVGDPDRVEKVVHEALLGGVRCVQLRESKWSARQMLRACERLMPMLEKVDGLLLVNDRIDVVAAGAAHGAQIGHRSLTPDLAREVLGPNAVLGYSAHDEDELALAAKHGCNFALLSPVWPTTSKRNAACLTVPRAAQLTAAAKLPVVWLGGVDSTTIAEIAVVPSAQRPIGVAVRSAIMQADDPQAATAELLQTWPK
jgi:thiamine-phosphate diphosphorylase